MSDPERRSRSVVFLAPPVETGVFMSYSDHIEPTLAWEIDLKDEA